VSSPSGTSELLERICRQNLDVYRASPARLKEDVSQEAQVANDYRGRLAYEILQNADDAMLGSGSESDRIWFVITDQELWVGNTGRPLTDADVEGLCGLGASTKTDAQGIRRASIGHKGMGFKSVLEITERPAVFSTTHSFELREEHARDLVASLWKEEGRPAPRNVAVMRFPAPVDSDHPTWQSLRDRGCNTAFRFPFRDEFDLDQRRQLADLLLGLPLTTVLEVLEPAREPEQPSASVLIVVDERQKGFDQVHAESLGDGHGEGLCVLRTWRQGVVGPPDEGEQLAAHQLRRPELRR
jgi:hypothetical protein